MGIKIPSIKSAIVEHLMKAIVSIFALIILCSSAQNYALAAGCEINITAENFQASSWDRYIGVGIRGSPIDFDIDNDGKNEILVTAYDKKVYAFKYNGEPLLEGSSDGSFFSADSLIRSSITIADIDNPEDGKPELIFSSDAGKVYALEYINRQTPPRVRFTFTADWYIYATAAVADLNNDSTKEIVIGSESGNLYMLKPTGITYPGWPINLGSTIRSSAALGDIDGDGELEIVIGDYNGNISAYNFDKTLVPGFPVKTGARILSSPALFEIEGETRDNKLEIAIGSGNGYLHLLRGNGAHLAGSPLYITNNRVDSSPSIAKFNGDIYPSILVGADNGVLTKVSWKDNRFAVDWQYQTGGEIFGSPAIGNIDTNAYKMEILVGSGDGKVYALDESGRKFADWNETIAGSVKIHSSALLTNLVPDDPQRVDVIICSYTNSEAKIEVRTLNAWQFNHWRTWRSDLARTGRYIYPANWRPTPTNTPTSTPSSTPTNTPTSTPTDTPTNTQTFTYTDTPTPTLTNTPTDTPPPSHTPSATWTSRPDPIGDISLDGFISANDILGLNRKWQLRHGDSFYDPKADLNRDGVINEKDLTIFPLFWHQPIQLDNLWTDIRILLTWEGEEDSDVDLLLVDPLGEVCKYGHFETKIGGKLTPQEITGNLSESFILPFGQAVHGRYILKVNYYSVGAQLSPVSAKLDILTNEGRQCQKILTLGPYQLEYDDLGEGLPGAWWLPEPFDYKRCEYINNEQIHD